MESVLIFLIFLGPLVFFHELGHFLFARLAGVRVEVFSIGFGPKLFSFKKGDTQYAFSLIPLGGYVKMFGDDPLSEKELTPEEEKVAYTKKGKWARFWIVFGGPLANFILAFFIYLSLVGFGEKVPLVKFGKVPAQSEFGKLGFKTGDVLLKVNDHEIVSFDDLNLIDSNISSISVRRAEGNEELIPVQYKAMQFLEKYGEYNTPLRAPFFVDGFGKTFLIEGSSGNIQTIEELFESNLNGIKLFEVKSDVSFKYDPQNMELDKKYLKDITYNGNSWESTLVEEGLYPRDLLVKKVVLDSPAFKANLQSGNVITGIAGKKISNFEGLRSEIQALKEEKPIKIQFLQNGVEKNVEVKPVFREAGDTKYLSIGVESGVSFSSIMVESKTSGVGNMLYKAYQRTIDGMVKTFLGFKKLITGEVSLKHVGGPIAIGQVASESFNISLSMFFRLMAIISINLGIINLFPIPVLDGGHIVFIFFEMINGGPLSRKKLMYAQQFGMSLLFLLIFVALYNDISRLF